MKKLLVSCLAALAVLALMAAPLLRRARLDAPEPIRPVLGYVETLSESSWRDAMSRSISEAADASGIQLMIQRASRTLDSQIQAVRTLITYNVDAIALSPVVVSGWENVLAEVRAAGIPVIFIERRANDPANQLVTAFVGTDHEAQGRQAARYIKDRFSGSAGTVSIMELLGTVGASSTVDRSHGIRSTLGRDGRYDIFYSVSCDMMYSKAKETCRIFLRNGQLPDVLISYNDAMTLGAIEAMEGLGIRPGVDVAIISFDAEQAAMDRLKRGEISCEIETDPHVGSAVMEAVLALERGDAPISSTLLPFSVYTPQSADGLAPRGY